jgi:RNA polymerase sigma-70 factor, ECF subfamily
MTPARRNETIATIDRRLGDAKETEPMTLLDFWSNVADHEVCPEDCFRAEGENAATAEEVFYAHAPLVYNVAHRVLGNEADAEDVTQEVLLRVLHKLDSFRGEGRLESWLHRVTVNAALLHRRKSIRRREREKDVPLATQARENSAANDSPAQRLLDSETRELIERAIDRLPKMYREVYVLADIEELSNADIAEILQLGVTAVKSRLHRARAMMREALAGHVWG